MNISLVKQSEDLFSRAKSSIMQEIEESDRGFKHFRKPIDLDYCSSDSGYMLDGLARITSDEEIYFLEEGSRCLSQYDMDEDECGIVAARMYLDDLTLASMCILADRVCHTKEFELMFLGLKHTTSEMISSLDKFVPIQDTDVNIDYDCKWMNIRAIAVRNDGFMDSDSKFYPFLGSECMTTMPIEEIVKLADSAACTIG